MNEKLEQLFRLIKENPELEVMFMTYYEVCVEGWGYWKSEIEKIEVEYVWENKDAERMFLSATSIREEMYDNIPEEELSEDAIEEEIDKIWNEKVAMGDIKKAIIVYLNN